MTDVFVRLKKDEKYYTLSGDVSQWVCNLNFSEAQAKLWDDSIIVAGKIESATGLKNFEDRNWTPSGRLVKLALHGATYKAWRKESGAEKASLTDVNPSPMELFFFNQFSALIKGDEGFKDIFNFK